MDSGLLKLLNYHYAIVDTDLMSKRKALINAYDTDDNPSVKLFLSIYYGFNLIKVLINSKKRYGE
jgi:hypothetical protein